MKLHFDIGLALFILFLCPIAAVIAADQPPGGTRIIPGYEHRPLQGIDSVVGEIVGEGGLTISYEIGHVTKPGQPQIGGGFRDRAKLAQKGEVQWYREQTVGGQPVHLAYRKDRVLLVSFPDTGANFSAPIRKSEDFADAMLMILTYPQPAAGGKKVPEEEMANKHLWVKADSTWEPAALPLAALAKGEPVEVKVRGLLQHGIFAIGGETTGTIIKFEKTAWELDLRKNGEFQVAADKFNGKAIVVTGKVSEKAGIEIRKRTILKVDSIELAKE